MNPSMEEFLSLRQAAGTYDSTDGFTLDTLKMGRKLAAYQLPERGLWVVKVVQGAVALGAESLSVRFGRRKVTLEFDTCRAGRPPTNSSAICFGRLRSRPRPFGI